MQESSSESVQNLDKNSNEPFGRAVNSVELLRKKFNLTNFSGEKRKNNLHKRIKSSSNVTNSTFIKNGFRCSYCNSSEGAVDNGSSDEDDRALYQGETSKKPSSSIEKPANSVN